MIAWTGVLAHKSGQKIKPDDAGIDPRWRTDDVEIGWIKS
jgi:tRNA A37 threonylcarbamoyltransferase TsaD